jgi:F-type H+-transporting ATPase subunit epsilon
MSGLMQFDLVSPEAALVSMEIISVEIPGAEGDFTALPQHAPLITSLRPGFLKVNSNDGTKEYVVSGGFVEINATSTSVLAEQAFDRENITKDIIDELVIDAEKALANCGEDSRDALEKRLYDTKSLLDILDL